MNELNQNSVKYYLPSKKTSKKTLVLDLDETLVHSQFVPFSIKSDLILKIELENQIHDIHVLIRPGVKEFLKKMGKLYEIVIFTASVSKYAGPLLDIIDKNHNCYCRLFREHCSMVGITYIKDLNKLGRDLKDIIIVDNSPLSYSFNHDNGLPILTWFNDKNDKELYYITPILEFLSDVYDVREYIKQIVINDCISYNNTIKVIENYIKINNDDSKKKYIDEILFNKIKYFNNKNERGNNIIKDNSFFNENGIIIIDNKTTLGKNEKKNYVNITISNNEINNYLYFSPIYNINNNPINNNKNEETKNNYDNINFDIKINPNKIQMKDKMLKTKSNRIKSKDLLNKININKKKKIINRSNNFKKIKYINKKNKKIIKEKINSAGNKSINYRINKNNSESKDINANSNILDLKTITSGKQNILIKEYQLPKTPEIEEILFPLHDRIINKINNKKSFHYLNKKLFKKKRGKSNDKNNNSKYQLRNRLYRFNKELKPINHEKHKSFNYYTPFNCEEKKVNFLKQNCANNYIFVEPISNTCKNKSHSNHKYIRAIKKNKIKNNNLSLNLVNKNNNDYNNQGSNNNNKSKLSLINNNYYKKISNQFKIIGITEYNPSNKIKKSLDYNLMIQNSNSTNNSNYKKINSTNRSINTENYSLKNYTKGLKSSNFRTISNNNFNRTNKLVNNKKINLLNNTILKNNLKKYKTNTNNFFNYENFIKHKKTLSYNGNEINSFNIINRTHSSSISKNKKNIKENKNNYKEMYINNIINQNNKKIIKPSKRDINDGVDKKSNSKITRIKEIKFVNYDNIIYKNHNKINISNNMGNNLYNLIDSNNNSNLNKIKKYVNEVKKINNIIKN